MSTSALTAQERHSVESHAAVEVRDLHMSYGSTSVLRGVDLRIGSGEVVALLGPNGAGKTTTIEILEGFRAPSSGQVRVLDVDPMRGDEQWRADIGVVLQSWRDHARWRVGETIAHFAEFYRPWSTPDRPRPWPVDELIERVGLSTKRDRQVLALSGGERRRLDVAIGLVGRPRLIFLDEPTAGFDPQARRDFHDLVRDLADLDVTILLTTHDLDEAEKLADRILVLAGGRIVADGTPDDLRRATSQTAEVRWARDGVTQVHSTDDPAGYLRDVLNAPGGPFTDLEVRRASLEDAYLALVHRVETGDDIDAGEARRLLSVTPGPGAPDRAGVQPPNAPAATPKPSMTNGAA